VLVVWGLVFEVWGWKLGVQDLGFGVQGEGGLGVKVRGII